MTNEMRFDRSINNNNNKNLYALRSPWRPPFYMYLHHATQLMFYDFEPISDLNVCELFSRQITFLPPHFPIGGPYPLFNQDNVNISVFTYNFFLVSIRFIYHLSSSPWSSHLLTLLCLDLSIYLMQTHFI